MMKLLAGYDQMLAKEQMETKGMKIMMRTILGAVSTARLLQHLTQLTASAPLA